jgi:ubiquinone/menaquinone biosynthesis C-methylase UbiE
MTDVICIGHTTRYRGGSAEFAVAANTMRRELAARHPDCRVTVAALDGKADFTAAMDRIRLDGDRIQELHFVGHAGMYGPMFNSTAWPEQFSPHEWRSMQLPLSPAAHAYFHTCRSARWFAPFFADTFGVPTWGHHGYTTVSARPDEFLWAGTNPQRHQNLYLIETVGRKTHGLTGSVRKYLGAPAIPMLQSAPTAKSSHAAYDRVATLYDAAYADIRVRQSEWRWLHDSLRTAQAQLGHQLRILDIGCGNGALLRAIDESDLLQSAVGVDVSARMLASARARTANPAIRFLQSDSPALPLPDQSVDVAISFLSFRYLDWDPVMAEVRRVLAPGGRLLVVDMVERRAELRDAARLVKAAAAHWCTLRRHPEFTANLKALTSHPHWQEMLRHNPIRAEHEYRWYLESRFPGAKLQTLTVAPRNRVVALDAGPLVPAKHPAMSYP